jgi:hypothetical protein
MSIRRMMIFTLGAKIKNIIRAFKTRVLADFGLFEAESCLDTQLTQLDNQSLFENASLIVTPNGRKSGKIYALKPFNGSGDLTVVRATSATYVGADGLIKTALANVPRLDYSNGSCPSILVEPQRTNLFTYSEQFENATWTKTNTTVTANTTISPDGNNNADTYNVVSTGANFIYQIPSLTTGSYSISVYAKKGSSNIIRLFNVSSGASAAWFDLNLGQVIGTVNGGTASIENSGNGWYRCVYKGTSVTSGFTGIGLSDTANSATASIGSSVYIWGAQIEQGSNATSYIPTVASAVTRNADVISKTGISSLINSEEGSFYVEASSFVNGGSFRQFALSNNTNNSRLIMAWSSLANTLLIRLDVLGVNIVNNNITSFNQTSNNKVLIKWGGGNLKTFVNGVERLSLTSLTMPNANLFTKLGFDGGLGANFFEGNVKSVLVFPTQLTDVQCIALTTL